MRKIVFYLTKTEISSRAKLIAIVLLGAILRLISSCDHFLHPWDERFHALVAKNLLHHWLVPTLYDNPVLQFDYKNWAGNYIWLHKPPLTLWVMALSMKIFGVNEFALRIPSILLSTIAIYLTYQIAAELFSKQVGLFAAFFHSINGFILEMTGGRIATDHPDLFFLFFIELAIFYLVLYSKQTRKIQLLIAGISMGCAILCKSLPALIVLPIFVILNFQNTSVKKLFLELIILMSIAVIVALPWQLYICTVFPKEAWWENHFNFLHIVKVLDQQGGPWYYYLQRATVNWNELIFIPFLWLCYKLVRTRFEAKLLAIFIWITIPYLFFSLLQTKMMGYLLFTGPAIFIVIGLFCSELISNPNLLFKKWLSLSLFILIVILSIRYSIERLKFFQNQKNETQITERIKAFNGLDSIDKSVIFNDDYNIETMFFTPAIAYNYMPSDDQVKELVKKGYKIYELKGNEMGLPIDSPIIKMVSILPPFTVN